MDPAEVEAKIRPPTFTPLVPIPKTALIVLENSFSSGHVVPLDNFKKIREIANKHRVKIHLDGSRIFHAAAVLGVDVKEIAKYADTVMFCLSKGLCCPVGSVVLGSKEFI